MGDSKLEINPATGNIILETDSKLILGLIDRLRSKLDRESNRALGDMMEQLENLYILINNSLTPFYRLNNDIIFSKEFGQIYENFKSGFNKDLDDLKYDSRLVWEKLHGVVQKHDWYTGKFQRLTRRTDSRNEDEELLQQLVKVIDDWYTNDARISGDLREYYKRINEGLDKVNTTLNTASVREARLQLLELMNDLGVDITYLKELIKQFKSLTKKLKR